jgi:hypothetical protein
MDDGMAAPRDAHQRGLANAFHRAELTVHELWLRYLALGGDAGPTEVDAYLNGLMPLPPLEHNLLALAINERLRDLPPPPQAPYY